MTAQTILSALETGAKAWGELPPLPNKEQLVDKLRRDRIIFRDSVGRYFKPVPEVDTRACLTCKQEIAETEFAPQALSCEPCRQAKRERKAERQRKLKELFKQGKKQCATCGNKEYIYRFKKFKSGNRCKDCYDCLMARKRKPQAELAA